MYRLLRRGPPASYAASTTLAANISLQGVVRQRLLFLGLQVRLERLRRLHDLFPSAHAAFVTTLTAVTTTCFAAASTSLAVATGLPTTAHVQSVVRLSFESLG